MDFYQVILLERSRHHFIEYLFFKRLKINKKNIVVSNFLISDHLATYEKYPLNNSPY